MANVVILTGRITKELELGQTSSAEPKTFCKFSLAVDRPVRGSGCDFIPCVVWGKSAENLVNWVKKGFKIMVQGEWRTGSYQGKNGRVYTHDCNVGTWDIIERPKTADNSETLATSGADTSIPSNLDFMNFDGGDDVPFS